MLSPTLRLGALLRLLLGSLLRRLLQSAWLGQLLPLLRALLCRKLLLLRPLLSAPSSGLGPLCRGELSLFRARRLPPGLFAPPVACRLGLRALTMLPLSLLLRLPLPRLLLLLGAPLGRRLLLLRRALLRLLLLLLLLLLGALLGLLLLLMLLLALLRRLLIPSTSGVLLRSRLFGRASRCVVVRCGSWEGRVAERKKEQHNESGEFHVHGSSFGQMFNADAETWTQNGHGVAIVRAGARELQ